jgi:hypothetical protein
METGHPSAGVGAALSANRKIESCNAEDGWLVFPPLTELLLVWDKLQLYAGISIWTRWVVKNYDDIG